MTDHPVIGKSISEKDMDSLLTVRDLLAVPDSLFSKDFSARVKAVASESSQGTGSGAVISTGAPDIAAVTQAPVAGTVTEGAVVTMVGTSGVQPDTSARHWYAVTVGREVGIFTDWQGGIYCPKKYPSAWSVSRFCPRNIVAPLVLCVSGACYPRYSSCQAAEEAFQRAIEKGTVHRVV